MKIAQIAPIIESVPPQKYGGTERVVWELTEELVRRGHDVTLFATKDSKTHAKLLATFPQSLRKSFPDDTAARTTYSHLHLGIAYELQRDFDIIHDHTGTFGCAFAQLSPTPTVMTLHGFLDVHSRAIFSQFSVPYYVTISNDQKKHAPELAKADTVYNGLDFSRYPIGLSGGSFLVFVGRITPQKGVHHAIEIARRTNMPLIIAAKYEPEQKMNREYFEKQVKPHLSKNIRFVGEVSPRERNKLFQHAFASLHTATWEEPFGLTIIEAAACGCPVIALNHGAIPELIANGVNGFVAGSVNEMVRKVKKVPRLNRLTCAHFTRSIFSAKQMTQKYEYIYQNMYRLSQYVYKRAMVRAESFQSPYLEAPFEDETVN